MFPAENERAAVVAWVGTYHPDSDRSRHLVEFALILAGLFMMDIVTTHIILQMGGVELNPVMTSVVPNPIIHLFIKMAIFLMIVLVSLVAEKYVRDSGVFFYCILITLYLLVITNNVFVILPKIIL